MSKQTSKRLIERYYSEMWNQWNFSLVDELLSEEISFRGSLGVEMRGRAAFCDYMERVRNAFPDFFNKIEDIVTEGDRVVVRLSYTGTHRGEIFGVGPTGRSIRYAGAAFFRIDDGWIAEGWVLGDLVSLFEQLGVRSIP